MLVAREGIRHDMDFHILHALNESIETLGGVVEQCLPRYDQLPLTIPN
jgi:hypothetical protein